MTPACKCETYDQLLVELISLLEVQEETDEGRLFHPTRITSCRAADAARINNILTQLKHLAHN